MATKRTNRIAKQTTERQRQRYDCPAEEFIRIYQGADSIQEVVDKTHMPYDIVLARVSSYRRKGLPLKKMKRANSKKLDIQHLNKLIEEANEHKKAMQPEQMTETQEVIQAVMPELVKVITKTLEKRLSRAIENHAS